MVPPVAITIVLGAAWQIAKALRAQVHLCGGGEGGKVSWGVATGKGSIPLLQGPTLASVPWGFPQFALGNLFLPEPMSWSAGQAWTPGFGLERRQKSCMTS